MFGVIVSVLHVALTIRALGHSVRERFAPGIAGGVLRLAVMGLAVATMFEAGGTAFARGMRLQFRPTSSVVRVLSADALFVLGPTITFVVVFMAYRRFVNVPAREEDQKRRPFAAWLPVAILDAAFVAIAVIAAFFSERD